MASARQSEAHCREPYFAARERLDTYASLGGRVIGGTHFGLAYFRRDEPDLGLTLPNPRRDLLMATVNLRRLDQPGQMWCENRAFVRGPLACGDLVILDHRMRWSSLVLEPFEMVQLFIPVRALIDLTDELHASRIDTLFCPVTAPRRDAVMEDLTKALLPALRRPEQVNRLFADHIFNAMLLHLAHTYGDLKPQWPLHGGLTPRQLHKVTEFIRANLHGDVSLAALAKLCGLSLTHFGRAFRASTGQSPHRWLLQQRVECAKQLLDSSTETISEIALSCGFADQSHLTRVFHRTVGVSPSAWRRQRRC